MNVPLPRQLMKCNRSPDESSHINGDSCQDQGAVEPDKTVFDLTPIDHLGKDSNLKARPHYDW